MTDNILTPPHSADAEQAVIGGLMLDGGDDRTQKVMAMLKTESFFSASHAIIFSAIRDLLTRNKPIDPLTLSDELEAGGKQYGGFAYLAEMTKNTPSVANLVHYAAVVRDKAMERYAISKLNEATEMLYSRNSMTAVEKLESITMLTSQISDYAKTGKRRGLRSFGDVMDDWVVELEKRFDPSGQSRGLSTGIPSLDRMLSPKGVAW